IIHKQTQQLLYRISGSLALLSCIGAVFVIITFIWYKDLKKHPTRMVFFLSICDLIFSAKYMITSVIPNSQSLQQHMVWCNIQAALQQFFGLASISWSGMISLNLILTSANPFRNTSSLSKWYHVWVWGLSLVSTVLMFALDYEDIGPSGDGTCWLMNKKSLMRLSFFVPLMAYFALSIGSLITAFYYSGNFSTLSDENRRGMLIRMSSYTAVFILCWLGPVIHRTVQWTEPSNNKNGDSSDSSNFDPTPLMYFDAIGVSVQGFMNAIVWLTNPQFFKGFTNNVKRVIPCLSFNRLEENIPLLKSLKDDMQDPTQLATSLRNYILTCCLKGITLSVGDNTDPVNEMSIKMKDDCKIYTEQQLFREELSIQSSSIKKHQFKDYTPKTFAAIRSLQGITPEEYLRSFNAETFFDVLSNQKFSEGKSGSFMCFTPDNKYLIKTITQQESVLLRNIMIKFYDYFKGNSSSYLLRFYGNYKIVMPNHHVYLAVMSNVFSTTKQKITERYDLKGSSVNRGGHYNYDPKTLGLDLDFINTRQYLNVPPRLKDPILNQLGKDSDFLTGLNIMDYSLLIGVHSNVQQQQQEDDALLQQKQQSQQEQQGDPQPDQLQQQHQQQQLQEQQRSLEDDNIHRIVTSTRKEVVYIGIIDILQLYDFSKKRERFLKVYFARKDGEGISSAPPKFYRHRFMKRMKQIIGGVYE
ncbi:hypothetical protein SAMD00019534_014560, partial [Acytostelium subglobosum LB1]|uniref:hypothetical protein n=1 Tax=Acytostelium subglobosum LB1 TaxID=1410327 RepID=UPI000644BB5A